MKRGLRTMILIAYSGAWCWYLFTYDRYDQHYYELLCESTKTEGALKRWHKKLKKLTTLYNEWEHAPFMREKCAREKLQYHRKGESIYLVKPVLPPEER